MATPERLPLQLYLDSCDPTRTAIIDNLPDEVLLEIFGFYWQSFRARFQDQPSYEKVWNNKNGWFRLAHVCHNWRSVVLASPSRLQLRLYFIPNSPTRAVVLDCHSHLPIIVDYLNAKWNASLPERLISALRYPDRVRRIAISTRGSEFDSQTKSGGISRALSRALDLPLPSLDSLELYNIRNFRPILLAASFVTSIQSLRHLRLRGSTTFPLLSITTSLVDLTLDVDSIVCLTRGELLADLERIASPA